MSSVARWSRFLTALVGAIAIWLIGLGLARARVIEDPRTALWPTYDLLNLDVFHGAVPPSTMWFAFGIQIAIWTAVLYALMAVGGLFRRR